MLSQMIKNFKEFLENVGNNFAQEPSWGGGLFPKASKIEITTSFEDGPFDVLKEFESELDGIADVGIRRGDSGYYFEVEIKDMRMRDQIPKSFKNFNVVITSS